MRRVLIFYSHFAPAFKAGGPVQSLTNMVEKLKHNFNFFVICGARDLGDKELLKDIVPDKWNEFSTGTKVFYSSHSILDAIRSAFKNINPDVVYVNGMFLPLYNWLPLWLGKRRGCKVVLAPRGMLQNGALAVKSTKKKLFLSFFKCFGFHKQIIWHATDLQEREDILKLFGNDAKVILASNIPKAPVTSIFPRIKQKGNLRLVYLSLITKKKNLDVVLDALKVVKVRITFDIYGPIVDETYWKYCQKKMEGQNHAITYKGVVNPTDVQQVLSDYHVFVLPTKGENFGHAIYESLSTGMPAMISKFTPWGYLQEYQAGLTIDSENPIEWANAIQLFINYDQEQFSLFSNGAYALASQYYSENSSEESYINLLS